MDDLELYSICESSKCFTKYFLFKNIIYGLEKILEMYGTFNLKVQESVWVEFTNCVITHAWHIGEFGIIYKLKIHKIKLRQRNSYQCSIKISITEILAIVLLQDECV